MLSGNILKGIASRVGLVQVGFEDNVGQKIDYTKTYLKNCR